MGIYSQRVDYENNMLSMKEELEADGVKFIVYANQYELFPGVWITGPFFYRL